MTPIERNRNGHVVIRFSDLGLAIVPGNEIVKGARRKTKDLRGMRHEYGYGVPLCAHIQCVCESISGEWMKEMRFLYITSLHSPIISSCGRDCVLSISRDEADALVIGTYCGHDEDQWDDLGAFVFPDLELS